MDIKEAAKQVQVALAEPFDIWPGFNINAIPIAIFDANEVMFFNYEAPPQLEPDMLNGEASPLDIDDVLAAVLDVTPYQNKDRLIAALYRRAFQVFQQTGGFAVREKKGDMFHALAFFPQLDPEYRTYCQLESDIWQDDTLPTEERLPRLVTVIKHRHEILARGEGVLDFDLNAERMQGTAAYIGGKVYWELSKNHLANTEFDPHQWSRQRNSGALLCHALDTVAPDWKTEVGREGVSPSKVVIGRFVNGHIDPDDLGFRRRLLEQQRQVEQLDMRLKKRINLLHVDPIHIQFPENITIERNYQASTLFSTGKGQLIHEKYLDLHLPHGEMCLRGRTILEDYTTHQITFEAVPLRMTRGKMDVDVLSARIHLSRVKQLESNVFQLDGASDYA